VKSRIEKQGLLTFACEQDSSFSVHQAEFNSLFSSLATSLEKSPK